MFAARNPGEFDLAPHSVGGTPSVPNHEPPGGTATVPPGYGARASAFESAGLFVHPRSASLYGMDLIPAPLNS